ncbi:MAG: DUF1566 domain-containing protein [Magnetococcus sp. YQC-5]
MPHSFLLVSQQAALNSTQSGGGQKKMNLLFVSIFLLFFLLVSPLMAGPQPAPAVPTEPGSAMYTLEDLYNRLNSGEEGSKRTGPFTEPMGTPGATGHNLNEIMSKAPLPDNAHGATAADVACGGFFWGVRTDGTWGQQVGTAPPCPPTHVKVSSDQRTLSWDPTVDAISYNLYFATQTGLTQDNYASLPGGGRIKNVLIPYTHTIANGFPYDTTAYLSVAAVVAGGTESLLSAPVTTILPRFVSNNNGTVTDLQTGLTLLQNPGCFDRLTWDNAMAEVAKLGHGQCGLTDGSLPGQWRLPSQAGGELKILNAAKNHGVFVGVQSDFYWSSTPYASNTSEVWILFIYSGTIFERGKTFMYYVWPVRDGQ